MELVTVKTPIPKFDLLSWLKDQNFREKFYLKLRDKNYVLVGLGNLFTSSKAPYPFETWTFEDFEEFFHETADPALKYFVTQSFFEKTRGSCILPRFEILQEDNQSHLILRHWPTESPDEFHRSLVFNPLAERSIEPTYSSHALRVTDSPSQEEWPGYFRQAQETFEKGKIVLARKTEIETNKPINAYDLLKNLNQNSYQCLFQSDGESQWISVSPEKLFHLNETDLTTEALAGTRPRGVSEQQDESLAEELRVSQKDRIEHQFVVDDILEKLRRLEFQKPFVHETEIKKYLTVQHLSTEIESFSNEIPRVYNLLHTLHPTAALGGTPHAEAIQWLQTHEPFERQFYGAPVGLMTKSFSEFFVNIRSAHIMQNRIEVYVGAGVIKTSQVDHEWLELEKKGLQILRFFK